MTDEQKPRDDDWSKTDADVKKLTAIFKTAFKGGWTQGQVWEIDGVRRAFFSENIPEWRSPCITELLFDPELHKACCRVKYGYDEQPLDEFGDRTSNAGHESWEHHLMRTAIATDRIDYVFNAYCSAES